MTRRLFRMIIASIASVGLIGSASQPAFAQTWHALEAPEGGILYRFYQVDDVVIAAASMKTYRSTDGGEHWQGIDTLPTLTTMNSAIVVEDTIVGLFPGAGVYRSSDKGVTWTQATDAKTSEQYSELAAIGSTIIARTGAGVLYRSKDLASSWEQITPPNDTMALEMGTDATHLTIFEFTTVYSSSDLGETWQSGITMQPGDSVDLFVGDLSVQFAFIRSFSDFTTGMYRSTDGGVTWTFVTNAPSNIQEVADVKRFDSGLLALIRTGSGSYFPIVSSDNGVSWTTIPTPPNDFFSAIGAFDSTLFLTGQQVVQRTTTMGNTWTPSSQGTYSVTVGVIAGSNRAVYTAANGSTTLLRSLDGLNWTPRNTLTSAFRNIFCTQPGATADQDEIFVSLNRDGLFRSTNGGASFTAVNNGIPDMPLDDGNIRAILDMVRVNSTTLILAVQGSARGGRHGVGGSTFGAEGFIRSTNNGASWSQSNTGFPTIGINEVFQANWDQINNLAVLPSGVVIATTRTQGIWRSLDTGASWQQANTGVPTCGGSRPTFADAVVLGNDVFVSIDWLGSATGCFELPTQVLKSSNNGASWTFSSTGMPVESRGGRMSVIDGGLKMIARASTISFPSIFESFDAGASWSAAASSPPTPLTPPIAVNGVQVLGTTFLGLWVLTPPPACPGDANGDNAVNAADLSVLLSGFGSNVAPGSGADLNNDGVINVADLSILLSNFGNAC